ncbi:hypothetical protein IID04_03770 [PVC group bacterium]|nr:hypothetical protein [PVC group bacterium]
MRYRPEKRGLWMKFGVWTAFVLLFAMTDFAWAEENDNMGETNDGQALQRIKTSEMIATTAPLVKPPSRNVNDGNITMEFQNAEIKGVLNLLAIKGKVNIVIDQEVAGRVTMRLIDVPWEKAIDVVIRSGGFVYEKDGNIYRVMTPEKLEVEGLKTRVFPLVYASAGEMIGGTDANSGILALLSDRGTMRYDARSNVLIVSDTAESLSRLAIVIEQLDTETKQVVIETKLIETTVDDDKNLGIDWTLKATVSGTKVPWTFPFPNTGLNWSWIPKGDPAASAPAFATNEGGGTSRMPASTTTTTNAFGGFAFGTLDASDFAATLEILKTNTGSRILSNPTITTLDNKTASIIVGRQDPVPAYSFNSDTGAWEITGFTYEESGVELEVTPQINRDEFITLKVHPRVRENIGTATFPSGGSTAEIPIFTVREATTEVIVPNGHTLLIGGLISRTTVDFESKVPLLGDIPVLGYLFKKTTKREDAKELLIFLTPSIARASRTEAEARKLFLPRTLRELEKERSNKGEKEKKKRAKSKKRRARKS